MAKSPSQRAPPARTPERWAKEFVEALNSRTGVTVRKSAIMRTARRDKRLCERIPASVVRIAEKSARAAGFSVTDWVNLGTRHASLLTRQPKQVLSRYKELAALLAIGEREVRRLVKQQHFLLCFRQGALRSRMAALQGVLGVGREDARRCAKACPGLLTLKPSTLRQHAESQRRTLSLGADDYRGLIAREPRLLLRSVETVRRFQNGMVKHWGLDRAEARDLILKSPKLIVSGLAERMQGNLTLLAHGFGCDRYQIIKALKQFPPLAYQDSERLIRALKAGAKVLDVRQSVLADAVLRCPSLLARRTEGWTRRMRLVRRITRVLGTEAAAEEVLKVFPAAMTYSFDRLLQRYVIARLGLWSWNWPTLLSLSEEKARNKLAGYFKEHRERKGLQKALRVRSLLA